MKKKSRLAIVVLIFLLNICPLSFSGMFIFSQEVGDVNIDGYQEWNEDREISGEVLIKPGARLVIGKGVTVTFKKFSTFNIEGQLLVNGTAKNPVIFKRENEEMNYSIVINSTGRADFRHADISGGGDFPPILMQNNGFVLKSAYAYAPSAIYVRGGGYLLVENSNFHDNINAIYIEKSFAGVDVKVNRSKFVNNISNDVVCISCPNQPNFRFNWWGSASGPEKIFYNNDRYRYEKISGNINFSNWSQEENFHDPIIIIPGMMGSWKWTDNGELALDPILGTYDDLIKVFKNNGYVENEDLIVFPYNWRASNVDTARLLKEKIDKIKEKNNWPKVDLVAHSMGGLVAREYIESDYYKDDVDQLLMVGTPHRGSPKSYLAWEGGEFGNGLVNNIFERILNLEAKENGFDGIFDYIRNLPVKSVQELLPDYDYLRDANNEKMRNYPKNYPINEFLENLNKEEKLSKLDLIETINIVGKTAKEKTISTIGVEDVPQNKIPLWPDGYPKNYDSIFGDQGIEYGNGDKTVPLFSAKKINVDELIETEFVHGELPSKTARKAYEYITGKSSIDFNETFRATDDIMIILVFSPVDIQVSYKNQAGDLQIVGNGAALKTEDGAYYAKYYLNNANGEKIGNEVEFITIPNPSNGEYEIKAQGVGGGEYRIEITKISVKEGDESQIKESTAIFSGVAKEGMVDEWKLKVAENEILSQMKDEIAPEIKIDSPLNKQYLNIGNLDFRFDFSDNVSLPDKISIKKYLNGEELGNNTIKDLSLEKIGQYKLKIEAKDEAENISKKEVDFKIVTDLITVTSNIDHYYELGMIRKQEAVFLGKLMDNISKLERIGDLAQNSRNLKLKDKNDIKNRIDAIISKYIDAIILIIRKKPEKYISAEAKSLLIDSLEYLKIK